MPAPSGTRRKGPRTGFVHRRAAKLTISRIGGLGAVVGTAAKKPNCRRDNHAGSSVYLTSGWPQLRQRKFLARRLSSGRNFRTELHRLMRNFFTAGAQCDGRNERGDNECALHCMLSPLEVSVGRRQEIVSERPARQQAHPRRASSVHEQLHAGTRREQQLRQPPKRGSAPSHPAWYSLLML